MDGNTEERNVQEKFIDTLMKMMKSDNISSYHKNVDKDENNDGIVLQDHEKHTIVNDTVITEPVVRHQNGHIPNNNTKYNQEQNLHYEVRKM